MKKNMHPSLFEPQKSRLVRKDYEFQPSYGLTEKNPSLSLAFLLS